MKGPELKRLRNGMISGTGAENYETTDDTGDPHQYNLSGAASVMIRLYDEIQQGRSYPDDFPDTVAGEDGDGPSVERVGHAQLALQRFEDAVPTLLASFVGNDDVIEDENGNVVAELPNAATTASKSANIPDVSN